MKERRVKFDCYGEEIYGSWIDNVAMGHDIYGVVVADDGKIYGVMFSALTLVSENFKE